MPNKHPFPYSKSQISLFWSTFPYSIRKRTRNLWNYANPVYGAATICHQVRWLRWGHPSLFHTATSLLIWYKMFCARDISYRLIIVIWMEFINMFSVYAQSGTHCRFKLMNYCGFNIQPFCSDVCGDHRRPQTLAEMCRNMSIWFGFRSVAVWHVFVFSCLN